MWLSTPQHFLARKAPGIYEISNLKQCVGELRRAESRVGCPGVCRGVCRGAGHQTARNGGSEPTTEGSPPLKPQPGGRACLPVPGRCPSTRGRT